VISITEKEYWPTMGRESTIQGRAVERSIKPKATAGNNIV
jgi:hypothetical protein